MKKTLALVLALLIALSTLAFAASYTDKGIVKQVQQALNDAGYDCGTPDGVAGKKTAAAITQYQTDKGLNATGIIDDALLQSLGVDVAAEAAPESGKPSVGSIVTFGHYEQDNDESNGPEDIEWIVLKTDNDSATLISRYALDEASYHSELGDVTWESTTLRKWLNDGFLNAAFTPEEQERLKTVTVPMEDNAVCGTVGGNDTEDTVYLLSVNEVFKLLPSAPERMCAATPYAEERGASNKDGACHWWLRTPGYYQFYGARVERDGNVGHGGHRMYYTESAVRPVIVLKLS